MSRYSKTRYGYPDIFGALIQELGGDLIEPENVTDNLVDSNRTYLDGGIKKQDKSKGIELRELTPSQKKIMREYDSTADSIEGGSWREWISRKNRNDFNNIAYEGVSGNSYSWQDLIDAINQYDCLSQDEKKIVYRLLELGDILSVAEFLNIDPEKLQLKLKEIQNQVRGYRAETVYSLRKLDASVSGSKFENKIYKILDGEIEYSKTKGSIRHYGSSLGPTRDRMPFIKMEDIKKHGISGDCDWDTGFSKNITKVHKKKKRMKIRKH